MTSIPYIVLASSSPRRQQLLRQIGASFIAISPDVDESTRDGEHPAAMVERLSLAKASAVVPPVDSGVVLGSDTIVTLGDEVLGKPSDPADARQMLSRLSGRTHVVYTGFALVDIASGDVRVGHEATSVTFRVLQEEEIARYVETGSPMDKAGSYGIQDDFGAVFVERIDGDYYTVVGLPLARVYVALREMGRRGENGRGENE